MTRRLLTISIVIATLAAGAGLWRAGTLWSKRSNDSEKHTARVAESVDAFSGLDEHRQKLIWDLEHATFEFEERVGKPFCEALKSRHEEQLAPFFASDFKGTLLSDAPDRSLETSGVVELSWSPKEASSAKTKDGSEPVTRDRFIRHLFERVSQIDEVEKVRLRVLKISVESDDVSTGHWTMKTLLKATGSDEDGASVAFKQTGTLRSRFPLDRVITQGPVLETWTIDSATLTRSQPLMSETTAKAGLDQLAIHDNWLAGGEPVRQYTLRTAVSDFDRDGDPDISIITNSGRCYLLANNEGRFLDRTSDVSLPQIYRAEKPSWLVTWIDVDNDGFDDLLLGSVLYRNVKGRRFEKWSPDPGLRFEHYPMGAAVADYNADGLLDIYVLNQHRRPGADNRKKRVGWVGDDVTGAPNQLFQNQGGEQFEDVTETAGVAGGARHSFAATWLHANEDHYPDLYVANDFARNSFFINDGRGGFRDISESSGTADFATSMGVASGDIDGDGRSDIYVANMYSKMGRRILGQVSESDYPDGVYKQLLGACAGNRLYQATDDVTDYEEVSVDMDVNAVGWAYAPALADFDADGFLDIYATAGFLSFQRGEPDG